jgi:hypothetical protein
MSLIGVIWYAELLWYTILSPDALDDIEMDRSVSGSYSITTTNYVQCKVIIIIIITPFNVLSESETM